MTQNKKGQAALEYLMTYGWAILVVVIVLAALWALGVFNVAPTAMCNIGAGYECDSTMTGTALTLHARGKPTVFTTANITSVTVNGVACEGTTLPQDVRNESFEQIDLTCTNVASGASYSGTITATYQRPTDATTHVYSGTFSGTAI